MSATASRKRRHAPSAFGDDLRRFWNLTVTLAATDFKLRYFGSVLGYFWSLARPLMFFGVLYVVFTQVLRFGGDIDHYPVYLLTSIILWTFFVDTTNACVQCLVAREGLLRKMRFPRLVIPLSVALTALFNLGTNLIAVLVFALASGVDVRWTWLEMIPIVALLAVFAIGIGMLLSVLFVRFRDIQPIWEVFSQILFYGSPILYVSAMYEDYEQAAVMANPIAALLTQMRRAFIDPYAPGLMSVTGGWPNVLVPFVIVAAVFALGLWVFTREAPRIAENL